MAGSKTLDDALKLLREENHIIGSPGVSENGTILIPVDEVLHTSNQIYRRVGFPPYPVPDPLLWELYVGSKARLEQEIALKDYILNGDITVYFNGPPISRQEAAEKVQHDIESCMEMISMLGDTLYGPAAS